MAERTVTLRLRAVTDQYKKAMTDASAATGGLISKAGGMEAIGGKMKKLGGTLTRSVTLPMALAGGAAVKLATDFEGTFSRMVGLAGVAADEVSGLKDSVLDLAGETTRPPQELAEALFFIRSAGLDGQDALDALEMSARAAAAGLGDTVTVADAVTSAMNAYGADVLSAAEATDVLAATAEQGKVEASALAGQFGRLLPISSELGVTFDQVGGAMGFLTRTSGSAELAATQLGGVLNKLLEPGERGRKTLTAIGWSMDGLRASVKDKGLLVTLEDLRSKLEANGMEFSSFAEDQQFLQGALMLTGQNFEAAAETIDAVGDSAGKTDEAFAAFAETAGFKNQQAFAQLQAALIQIGDVLIPIVANIAQFASVLLDLFTSLPGPLQNALIMFGGLVAVTGPLMSIGGTIASNWKTMGKAFDAASVGAFNAAGNIGKMAAAGGALVAVTIAVQRFGDEMNKAKSDGQEFADGIIGGFDASKASADEVNARFQELIRVHNELVENGNNAKNPFLKERFYEAADAVLAEVNATSALIDETNAASEALGLTGDEALDLVTDVDALAGATNEATGELDPLAAAATDAAEAQEDLEEAIKGVTNALRAQFDPFFAAQDALLANRDAQEDVTDAEWAVIAAMDARNKAVKAHGKKSEEAKKAAKDLADAQRDLEDKNRKAVRSALDASAAVKELAMRMEDGGLKAEDAADELDNWVAQGLLTEEQAEDAARELGLLGDKATELEGRSIHIPVSADTSAYERAIADIYKRDNSPIRISVGGGGGVPVRADGGPIPGARGSAVPMVGHGGEFMLSADVVDAIKHGRPTAGLAGLSSNGGRSSGTLAVEVPVILDGREIGRSRAVIGAMDAARRVRDRNTAA